LIIVTKSFGIKDEQRTTADGLPCLKGRTQ
jgi:hypothetical protein